MLDRILVLEERVEDLEPAIRIEDRLPAEGRQRAALEEEATDQQHLLLRDEDGDVRLRVAAAEEDHLEREVAEVETAGGPKR